MACRRGRSTAIALLLGTATLFTSIQASAQITPVPSIRTMRWIVNASTGLCVTRDSRLSLTLSMQTCTPGNMAQLFFVFKPDSNVDQQFAGGYTDQVRILPMYREMLTFSPDHLIGMAYGTPGAMISLATQGDSAAPTPIAAPPTGAIWKLELLASPPTGYVFRVRNLMSQLCLSYVGHAAAPGTKVVTGECDPNFDAWVLAPLAP